MPDFFNQNPLPPTATEIAVAQQRTEERKLADIAQKVCGVLGITGGSGERCPDHPHENLIEFTGADEVVGICSSCFITALDLLQVVKTRRPR